jgi:hypothetical protein
LYTGLNFKKIVPAIRKRFGRKARIIVRGDSAFAQESIMVWCEQQKLFYCFGLACNQRLQASVKNEFAALERRIQQGELQSPCRSFLQFEYATSFRGQAPDPSLAGPLGGAQFCELIGQLRCRVSYVRGVFEGNR